MPDRRHILRSQIKATAGVWSDIQKEQGPVDRWLANYFYRFRKQFGSRDKKFISTVIYALFRHKSLLTAWAGKFSETSAGEPIVILTAAAENCISENDFRSEITPYCRKTPFHSGIYSMLQAYHLPDTVRFDSPEEEMALKFSFPLWLVKRWIAAFGLQEARRMLEASQTRPPLVVRSNPLKITREMLIERFKGAGFDISPTMRSPFGIVFRERVNVFDSDEFRNGFFEIQDEGSQLVCVTIDPKPGEMIWDVCAGGGGKTLLMAALMQNKGRLVATDLRSWKLGELKKRAQRAGAYNIFPADLNRMDEINAARHGFDKILVDAPCSGTGTLRRNPDAKWKLSDAEFELNHKDQVAILEKSLPYLRAGGKIYYATCSVDPVENEGVIQEVLSRHPELAVERISDRPDGHFHLLPAKDGTDGFFMAAMTQRSEKI
ncbi:MAG: RsmB/NOP family class I SAM-dependent RNA methyltransferase [Candidatus Omnitrophica bacterium]|nr:RsmB/NOP family class I SAM-dependent RNA methyltransferase [Candidatus Omnitrophota bacterium]